MEENKKYNYYVVEQIDPPCMALEKYVCVPDSWLVLRELDTQLAVMKHPVELPQLTRKRIKRKEAFSSEWPVFEVAVKFGSNSYKDAKNYIAMLYNTLFQEQNAAQNANTDKPSTSGTKSHMSESNCEGNRDSTPVCSSQHEASVTPRDTAVARHSGAPESAERGAADGAGAPGACAGAPGYGDSPKQRKRYFTRQSTRKLILDRAPSTATNITKLETSQDHIKENSKQINNNDNQSVDRVNSEICATNDDSNQAILFDSELLHLLKKMDLILETKLENIERLRQVYSNHSGNIKTMIKLVENFDVAYPDFIAEVEKKMAAMLINQNNDSEDIVNNIETVIGNKFVETIQENDADKIPILNANVCDDDVRGKGKWKDEGKGKGIHIKGRFFQNRGKGKGAPLKKRGIPRKFILPPGYDPNDSRWTLRYQEESEELVELMPHSKIYVNEIRLKNCIRLSKDSKTLARLLLLEVFTESALRTCSLTGKQASGSESPLRPGLDDHARTVLLNFVEDHALQNKWVNLDIHSVLSSLRNKIQEMRMKYG